MAILLKGARVLDPGENLDRTLDVRIVDGVIDAVGPDLPLEGAELRSCAGLLLTPGLIDGHVHVFEDVGFNGIDPDVLGVGAAVTTVVDAGSAGASSFAGLRRDVMDRAKTNVLAFVYVAANKLGMGPLEYASTKAIDEAALERVVEENREKIVGIKLRANVWQGEDSQHPMRRARGIAERLNLPLMVHIGHRPEDGAGEAAPIGEVVRILRPGDIVTHLFTGYPGGLLDGDGRLQPDVREAYNAGLRFDLGHGLYNMRFDTAARVLDQGIEPHSISTDGHKVARHKLVYDLPTTMAKMLSVGFTLPQVVNKATYETAQSLRRPELVPGIAKGRPALLSLLKLEEQEWPAEDSTGKKVTARQQLVPVASFRGSDVFEAYPADVPRS
jgi:dihydroorotase